jgi:hypothetical protein
VDEEDVNRLLETEEPVAAVAAASSSEERTDLEDVFRSDFVSSSPLLSFYVFFAFCPSSTPCSARSDPGLTLRCGRRTMRRQGGSPSGRRVSVWTTYRML